MCYSRYIFDKPETFFVSGLFSAVYFFVFLYFYRKYETDSGNQCFLISVVQGRELLTGILTSQVISNVPAAILLSGFSGDFSALMTGVNLGGLGTLIASLASLISFKFFAREYPDKKAAYLKMFTVWNIIFLAILVLEAYLLRFR